MLFGFKSTDKNRTFAIGDIHGCARELESLIEKIAPEEKDTVVFLGDYIDRGPESRRVIDLIIALGKRTNVVAIMGNHEQMFMDFLEHPESAGAGLFILNGGGATLSGYLADDGSFAIPEAHLNFLRNLKLYHSNQTHFFVHAGVPNGPLAKIDPKKDAMTLLWVRQAFLGSSFKWEKVIVHGHTPVESPEILKNRINLDTGCVYDGFLTALELPSGAIHQVEKGIKNEVEIIPKKTGEGRIAMRFSGRVPISVTGPGGTFDFETLNYNKFGLLMCEKTARSGVPFKTGDKIEGHIGGPTDHTIHFKGEIVRTDSRSDQALFGVKIIKISDDNAGYDTENRRTS